MTLILVAGTPQFVCQVADRRLVRTDPADDRVVDFDDEMNKQLVVRAADSDFAVSITGLAEIEKQPVIQWLMDALQNEQAPKEGLEACVEAVQKAASAAFRRIHASSGTAWPHSFVFAGYMRGDAMPRVVVVTNYRRPDGKLTRPDTIFHAVDIPGSQERAYYEDGRIDALDAEGRRVILRSLRSGQSHQDIADAMVSRIRRAASHPDYGEYVGKNCMCVWVYPSGAMDAVYYPAHGRPETYAPDLIDQTVSMRGVYGNVSSFSLGERSGGLNVFDARTVVHEPVETVVGRAVEAGTTGKHDEALRLTEQVLRVYPENDDARYNHAAALAELKQPEEALAELYDLISSSPTFARAHQLRGRLLLEQNEHQEALSSLDEAARLGAGVQNERGVALSYLGRHEQALEAYNGYLRIAPSDSVGLANKAQTLLALRRYKDTLAFLERLDEGERDNWRMLAARAAALQGLKKYRKALRYNTKALALNSEEPDLWLSRAVSLDNLGQRSEALRDCDRAVGLRPQFPEALYVRACLLAIKRKPGQALRELTKAIDLRPSLRRDAGADKDFRILRSDPRFQEIVGEEPSGDQASDD